MKRYYNQLTEFENFTLYQLHLTHKFTKDQWRECEEENVVCIFSCSSPLCKGPQWEEFCCVKVLLHVCHWDLQQLTENRTVEWSALYDHYIEEINTDPIDLLGLAIDNEENEIIDEEDKELLKDDEENEFQPD